MNILFYSPTTDDVEIRLHKAIAAVTQKDDIEVYRTINSLSRRLLHSTESRVVAVLLAASREHLSELISINDMLSKASIILILPDSEPETVALGHILLPRFLSYNNSDFMDVAAVLSKMLSKGHT